MKVHVMLEIERGDECYDVEVEALVTLTVDPDYGADADGNRGMPATFVDIEDVWRIDETLLTPAELETMRDRLIEAAECGAWHRAEE